MVAKKYLYYGEKHTIAQLAEISGQSTDFIRNRINRGWSVEAAVDTPKEEGQIIPTEYMGKVLTVCFHEPLASVFPSMQPKRETPYIACPATSMNRSCSKTYYTINLDNEKKLIVYPGEFEILGIVE